jgi:hypothetical protein
MGVWFTRGLPIKILKPKRNKGQREVHSTTVVPLKYEATTHRWSSHCDRKLKLLSIYVNLLMVMINTGIRYKISKIVEFFIETLEM